MEDWVGYKFDNACSPGGEVYLTSGDPELRFIVVEEASHS
jgi:hypothetical protein